VPPIAARPRPGGDFTAIGLSAPVTVHVTQGSTRDIELKGDEAALAELETVIENSTLKIRLKKDVRRWNHKVEVRVSAPRIDALAIAGSGDISAPAITGESLKVSISGSGDVRVGGKVADSPRTSRAPAISGRATSKRNA
jgi:hypothetical protein